MKMFWLHNCHTQIFRTNPRQLFSSNWVQEREIGRGGKKNGWEKVEAVPRGLPLWLRVAGTTRWRVTDSGVRERGQGQGEKNKKTTRWEAEQKKRQEALVGGKGRFSAPQISRNYEFRSISLIHSLYEMPSQYLHKLSMGWQCWGEIFLSSALTVTTVILTP